MKVALANYFHPFSGIGKYAFLLFDKYKSQKKQVDMFYFETRHNRIGDKRGIIKIKKNTPFVELNKAVLPYFYFPKKIPEGYDVYHAANQYLSRLALYRRPCVVTHHDIRPMVFPHDIKMRAVGIALKYLLKSYKKAAKIIAITKEAKESLVDLKIIPEEKIEVIYHGYNKNLYKPIKKPIARKKLSLPQDAKIVLNIGTEDPMRRIPLILEAMQKIQKNDENVLLIRVGGSIASGGYWQTSDKLKKQINMKQFRNVPEEDMPLIYNSADVFVGPQIYDEGFSYPVVEAMACGIPIMTSNIKTFEKWGINIPGSPEEFAEVLENVLNNRLLQNRLSKKSLEGAREFSLEKEARCTYKIYEEMCKS